MHKHLFTGICIAGLLFGCKSLDENSRVKSNPSGHAMIVGEGQACGGATVAPEVPARCAEGLICQNEANDLSFPGTCQKQQVASSDTSCQQASDCDRIAVQQSASICAATGKELKQLWRCQNKNCRLYKENCAGRLKQVCRADKDCDAALQQSVKICQGTGQKVETSWRCVSNSCELFTPPCK